MKTASKLNKKKSSGVVILSTKRTTVLVRLIVGTSKYNPYKRVITWGIVLSTPFVVVTCANIYIYVNKRRIPESCEYAFTRCTVFVRLGFQRHVIETFSKYTTIRIKSVSICRRLNDPRTIFSNDSGSEMRFPNMGRHHVLGVTAVRAAS